MLFDQLKKFATADAPREGRFLFSNVNGSYGSNLSLVSGIPAEINDIVQRGDSLLKKIPLKHKDVIPSIRASIVLRDIVLGKDVQENVPKIMRDFIKNVDKLIAAYYVPKVKGSRDLQERYREDGEALQARYDFLLVSSAKSPDALRQFEREFYPDGCWDPELADEIVEQKVDEGVVSLSNRRQSAEISKAFDQTLKSNFVQNPIFSVQAMLGTPTQIEEAWAAVSNLGCTIRRNERTLSALQTINASLTEIICPKSAQIHHFPT